MCNKIKNKIYHAVGTFLKYNRKIKKNTTVWKLTEKQKKYTTVGTFLNYNREMKLKNTTLSEINVRAKGVKCDNPEKLET